MLLKILVFVDLTILKRSVMQQDDFYPTGKNLVTFQISPSSVLQKLLYSVNIFV